MRLRRHHAFTLLELLLVIAVMAIVAMSGIAAYNQYITRLKVERSALQMQAILVAAQNFHTENSTSWPTTSADIQKYIGPKALETCPWPYAPQPLCYTIVQPTPDSPTSALHVDLVAPNMNIAQAIMARLPEAYIDSNPQPNTLHAYLVTPIRLSAPAPPPPPPASQVMAAQPFISGNPIHVYACPTALPVATIFFALGGADIGNYENNYDSVQGFYYIKAGACYFNTGNPCAYGGIHNGPDTCNPADPTNGNFANPFVIDPQATRQPTTLQDDQITPYICTASSSASSHVPTNFASAKKIQGIAFQMCGPEPANPT